MSARNIVSYASILSFVEQHPTAAAEFLLGWPQERKDELAAVIFHANQQTKSPALDTSVASNIFNARDIPVRTRPGDSQRPGSSSGGRRSVHDFPTSRQMPPSPTRTTSSHSGSLTSKDGRENILILATDEEGDVKEYVARMRTAHTERSVIGEHMFQDGRICEENIITIPEQRVAVPMRNSPGASKEVVVRSAAKLAWIRPRSGATHHSTFYLVPSENVGIDVLLGYHDSGEEFVGNTPLPPQRTRGFSFVEPTLNAAAHQAIQQSFHASSHLPRSTLDEKPDPIINDILNRQREGLKSGERTSPQHSSPSAHYRSAQSPSRTGYPNSQTPTVVPITSEPRADKIRLTCKFGPLLFQCWLYLDAPGEAFCENVQKEFRKRKQQLDRPNTTIVLKSEKEASDSDAYYLSLDEDALEADWGQAVDWLRANKRNVSPHIYGTIQIDDGKRALQIRISRHSTPWRDKSIRNIRALRNKIRHDERRLYGFTDYSKFSRHAHATLQNNIEARM